MIIPYLLHCYSPESRVYAKKPTWLKALSVVFAALATQTPINAGLALSVHPHMLRHACGFYLASSGHDTRAIQAYLGHKNIQHTIRYTELSPDRFKNFWLD